MTLAVEVMIAGVFASGINLLIGSPGLVSLGRAMFLGLGGYGIAVGTALLGWPLWVSAPITLVVVAMIAAAIGAICIPNSWRRVSADYACVLTDVLWRGD
jgi:branched-chain amino acid transport system permease protein